jgi:argininosuccinate lyase
MQELPLDEFREVAAEFGEDVYQVFDFRRSVEARDSYGGTATQAVRQQLARARERLGGSVLCPLELTEVVVKVDKNGSLP